MLHEYTLIYIIFRVRFAPLPPKSFPAALSLPLSYQWAPVITERTNPLKICLDHAPFAHKPAPVGLLNRGAGGRGCEAHPRQDRHHQVVISHSMWSPNPPSALNRTQWHTEWFQEPRIQSGPGLLRSSLSVVYFNASYSIYSPGAPPGITELLQFYCQTVPN